MAADVRFGFDDNDGSASLAGRKGSGDAGCAGTDDDDLGFVIKAYGRSHRLHLHVEDQALALAAGAADHDLVVRGLLLLAQHRVAVLGDSGNHPRHALAADA